MRYHTLLRILDRIRSEAPVHLNEKYKPDKTNLERVSQSRARAFIHLYLKVMFGITEFTQREHHITDGAFDGGIDGYYIARETKTIYIIQSKFRTTERNFEEKEIDLLELLAMDISRILEGEKNHENGAPYSGKIQQLQREVSQISDIARYTYRVIILANLKGVSDSKLRQITGGYSAEVFSFEKTYNQLVFPVLAGTYFEADDIVIPVDLSNKNAGSKISYNVKTKYSDCEITVLFVPTIEIARIMSKFRNSILKHNPRSYLELAGQSVNDAIRETILQTQTNEFALYNNGITMLSDETNINEKIGQKNKAQLMVKNPQIINGGQTSFTLSRIYNDNIEKAEEIFKEKEVLLKVITLLGGDSGQAKIDLIEAISNATNKQTPVINADRFSNEQFHIEIQKIVFEKYGVLYERKRGEFSDGVNDGYINASEVVERNHFWRIYYASNGDVRKAVEKRLFQKNEFKGFKFTDNLAFERAIHGLLVFARMIKGNAMNRKTALEYYSRVFAYVELFANKGLDPDPIVVDANLASLENAWTAFFQKKTATDAKFKRFKYFQRGHFQREFPLFLQEVEETSTTA